MDSQKYIGLDVHQESISVAVRDTTGKLLMECIIETKAATILQFVQGLRGTLLVGFEEGTSAAWLYDLLKPHVAKVIVCDPRKNALLKAGNKNDRIDARKLSELLRAGLLTPVYHGESGVRTLRELARSYLAVTKDLTRVMNRLKALYRSWAIACTGQKVYSAGHRSAWLEQLSEPGVRRRAERLYSQFDSLRELRREARRDLLAESQRHPASEFLRQIPRLGPIRVALLIALLQTPHRFRTKRQLWAYCGLALQTRSSGEYRFSDGQVQHSRRPPALRGLNVNHNRDLKSLFKGAATHGSASTDALGAFYQGLLTKGMKPAMARLTLARKIAAIALKIWKKGERFDPELLNGKALERVKRADR
jgi:transposase